MRKFKKQTSIYVKHHNENIHVADFPTLLSYEHGDKFYFNWDTMNSNAQSFFRHINRTDSDKILAEAIRLDALESDKYRNKYYKVIKRDEFIERNRYGRYEDQILVELVVREVFEFRYWKPITKLRKLFRKLIK